MGRPSIDITGQRFGKLVARHRIESDGKHPKYYCECDCGNTTIVQSTDLLRSHIKSCGCISGKLKDLTNKTFGNLTVLKRAENLYGRTAWECQCTCGNKKIIVSTSLMTGATTSCGCKRAEKIGNNARTHGKQPIRLYNAWNNMKKRCYNPNERSYRDYGAKGISVCDEWKDNYENFRDWALSNGYSAQLTIDRINVFGNYCPSNCRWVSRMVQANNTTRNVIINFEGVEHTISEWAQLFNTPSRLPYNRRTKGWGDKYIFDPVYPHGYCRPTTPVYYEDVLLPIILKEKESLSA